MLIGLPNTPFTRQPGLRILMFNKIRTSIPSTFWQINLTLITVNFSSFCSRIKLFIPGSSTVRLVEYLPSEMCSRYFSSFPGRGLYPSICRTKSSSFSPWYTVFSAPSDNILRSAGSEQQSFLISCFLITFTENVKY